MALYRSFVFILTILVLAGMSCTKPVLIGSDFLEDEKASLNFEDNFDLSFFTEKTDSVIVHSDNVSRQLYTYLLGNINDPVFGRYSAEIFAQPILPTSATDLIGATLDSVVLQLRYDTLGTYGGLQEPVTIEVYRMNENPPFDSTYYSNRRFLYRPELLGLLTFVPKPMDSVSVVSLGDTIRIAPSIRIPLSTFLMSEVVFQDSSVFTNQEKWLDYFNGLYIRMTGANNTLLGFNLLHPTISGLTFYYDNVTTDKQFRLIFTTGSIKTVFMEHDYSGSFAETSLGPDAELDYWFVQGMSGLTTKMTIEGLGKLGNAIVNLAELDVYSTFPPGDMHNFYPPIRYLITQDKVDSLFQNSIDAAIALNRVNNLHTSVVFHSLYGGQVQEILPGPQGVYKYTVKLTSQVKEILAGRKENVIYFNPIDKPNVPRRSVMFGPGHPEYAPRLRIYYTSI